MVIAGIGEACSHGLTTSQVARSRSAAGSLCNPIATQQPMLKKAARHRMLRC
jgi:hypothetical protein